MAAGKLIGGDIDVGQVLATWLKKHAWVAVVCGLLMLVCSAPASANQMTLFVCHAPNGEVVGHAGWTIARTPDAFMTASDTCSSGGTGSLHLELASNGAGYGDQAGIDWIFQAPAWATIAAYTLQVPASYTYPFNGAGEGQAAIWASDETDPVYDYRNLGGGSWGAGTIQRTPPDSVTSLILNAACDGEVGSCPSGQVISRMDVSAGTLLLDDSTIPTISDLAGSLVSGGPLRGSTEASFTASNNGPGVYSAWLVVDGNTQPRVLLDSNNGWCADLGQTSDGTRSFSHPDPCAESVGGHITFDTTSLTDGQHTIQLDVDDASGNTTTAYNATVTTHNAPAVSTSPSVSGSTAVGAVLTGTPGTFEAPEGAGSLSSIASAWLRCSDAAATHCSAIPGAIDQTYTPSSSDTGYYIVYQNTVRDTDGSTTADSQPTLAVTDPTKEAAGFGGQSAGGGSSSSSGSTSGAGGSGGIGGSSGITVNLSAPSLLGSTSPWQVTLTVRPQKVRRGTTIKLSGYVATSPRPASGKLVYLQARTVNVAWKGRGRKHHAVRRYGKWMTFKHLTAAGDGKFNATYRFKLGGKHTYQFTAVAPQEGGFLNTTGTSAVVTVHERR
ncbi:MAG: hypothetical protein ACTHM1_05220 [Solirubrobacteraceae bacterium]